jgi:hypothetical protein
VPALQLPHVTLVAIDTRTPAVAAASLERSLATAAFARSVLFTHGVSPGAFGPRIEVVDIAPITSGAGYSAFVLHELPRHVHSSHALVTQWDGFAVDAAAWHDSFLQYDYIGAPWPDRPAAVSVGNGGFSLRSKRLLDALAVTAWPDEHPEDVALCVTHRAELEALGLRIAPPEVARRFAFENAVPRGPVFGFHGCYHLPRFVDEATIERWLADMPEPFFRSRDARRLTKALLRARMAGAAEGVVARRRAAGRNDVQTRLLGAAARLQSALGLQRRGGVSR